MLFTNRHALCLKDFFGRFAFCALLVTGLLFMVWLPITAASSSTRLSSYSVPGKLVSQPITSDAYPLEEAVTHEIPSKKTVNFEPVSTVEGSGISKDTRASTSAAAGSDGPTWWDAASGIRVNDVITGRQQTSVLAAGRARLYAAWLDHRSGNEEIYFADSSDGGYTWSASQRIFVEEEGEGEGEGLGLLSEEDDGPQLQIDVDSDETIYLLKSALAAAEEVRLFQIAEQDSTWSTTELDLPNDLNPLETEYVELGVDGSGTLYLLWKVQNGGDPMIWLSTSQDQGDTWSARKELASVISEEGEGDVLGTLAIGEAVAYAITGTRIDWREEEKLTVWKKAVGNSSWVNTTTQADSVPELADVSDDDTLYVLTSSLDDPDLTLQRSVDGGQNLTYFATVDAGAASDLVAGKDAVLTVGSNSNSYLFLPTGEALPLYTPYLVRRGVWHGDVPLMIGYHSYPESNPDVYLHLAMPLPPDQTWATCECPFGCSTALQNWAGGPINTRTGNYHYRETDVSLPGLDGALHFERSYNAQASGLYTQTLGPGWTHTYAQRLYFSDDPGGEPGRVIVQGCRGSRFRFMEQNTPNGVTYEPRPGVWATLTRTATTPYTYTLTGVDQSTYLFDMEGRLQAIRSPQGQMLTLRYANERLTGVGKAGSTYALTFTYDTAGRLQTVVDPLSRTVTYGYDAAGDLVTVTDTRGLTWTYAYTGSHLLSELRNPLGQLVERTAYDAYGRAIQQWTPQAPQPLQFAYGVTGTVVLTDALGQAERHRYTGLGTLGEEQVGVMTETRTYDAHLNWRSTTDARGHTTQYDFTPMGLPRVVTNTLGHPTQMTYDDHNHLTAYTDAAGRSTQYVYDEDHNLVAQTDALSQTVRHAYDEAGHVISTTNAAGETTRYAYNDLGLRVAVTDTTGLVTRYGYDAVGRLITTTDSSGRVTVNAYDDGDNLIRVTRNYTSAGGQNYQGLYNLVTAYGYDAVGRRVVTTDTLGHVSRSEYNAAGQLVRTWQNYRPGYPQNYQDTYNLVTAYGYDALGRQVLVTDTLGQVSYTEYDTQGRVKRSWRNYLPGYPQNYQETYNLVTTYGYDAVGNRTHVTDTLGHVTYTEYDELNRVQREWRNYLPGEPQNYQDTYNLVTDYGYDALGNQVLVTDTLGNVTFTEYDALNRPVTVTTNYVDGVFDPAHPDEDLIRVTTYDAAGRTREVTQYGIRNTRYEYDAVGRQVATIQNYEDGVFDPAAPDRDRRSETVYDPVTGQVAARIQVAGERITTTYAYDALGRLVTTTNALSGTTVTHYDALGRRVATLDASGERTSYAYDGAGRLVTTTNALSGTTVTHYDALGRRVGQTDALGHTTVYTYDAAGRLAAQADPLGNVTHYGYDALGHRTVVTDADGVATTSTYDSLGRLTATCDALDNCTHYEYDALGNRTRMTNAKLQMTNYAYDDVGHLIAVTENYSATGPSDHQTNVRTEYAYDALGNLRVITDALGHTTVYTYDLAGRRTAAADALGHVTRYRYDGHGRRVGEVYPGSTGLTTGDAGGPFTVTTAYDALGRPTAIDYPAVGDVPGFTLAYAYDAVGNRAVVTDATGTTTYDYDALYRPLGVETPSGDAHYTYNAAGQRTHLVYPTGEVVTYTHDAAGRLHTVTDWDGGVTVYSYTQAGRLAGLALPNGVETAYSYDAAGRLVELAHRDAAGDLLARYTYTLDAVGNRTEVTEGVGATGEAQAGSPAPGAPVDEAIRTVASGGPIATNRLPQVGYDTRNDRHLVVWVSHGGMGHPQILGRLIKTAGELGKTFTIAKNWNGGIKWEKPGVAYNASVEKYLVAWEEDTGFQAGIHGQLVDAEGRLQGQSVLLAAGGSRPVLTVASGKENEFLLVYTYQSSLQAAGLYAQRLDNQGNPKGVPILLTTADVSAADVAYDAQMRQYVAVWAQPGKKGDIDVYGRVVSEQAPAPFLIYMGADRPAVAYNPAQGRLLVTWVTAGGAVAGRQVGDLGGYLGPVVTFGSQANGGLAVGGNGATDDWLVVWWDQTPTAQVMHGNGTLSGGNQPLTGELSLEKTMFSATDDIAVSSTFTEPGRHLVVWDRDDKHIEARYFRPLDAGLRTAPTTGPTPLTVVFTATSSPLWKANRWRWTFGDGETSTLQHPAHRYVRPGVYTVSLTVTDTRSTESEVISLPAVITATEERRITYTYDPLNRLTAADYRSTTLTAGSTGESYEYAYDTVGNRTAMTETTALSGTVVTTYTYNAANQLETARANDDGVTWHYAHDQRGNLVRQTPGGMEPAEGEMRYTYNAANQLVRVELYTAGSYTTLAEGIYNADGERVRLTTYANGVPLTVTYGVFQGEMLMADDGTQTTLYLNGRSLIAEYGNEWTYHLRDGEGSVRQTADESGAITLVRAYKPFGGILEEQGQYETAFGFLGAQFDRISGLLYAGGRYYDPATGRFLTPDRTFDPYDPRTLNPYAPLQNPALWLLAPLAVLVGFKRRKHKHWLLLLVVGMGTTVVLTGCEPPPPLPPTEPPPTLPPLEDTDILDVPWVDEMDQEIWNEYPNSCGMMAMYMFLQAEGRPTDLSTLAQQLREERPGGYDGYCCSQGWGVLPPPTPDPLGWCNETCVSAEALADVARKHYGLAIDSGDNWTRERVHQKLLNGHPVLALVRVDLSIDQFGHFVVIRGLVNQGTRVVFNDSFPRDDRRTWNMSSEERRTIGEGRGEDWTDFDRSWASAVDKGDPLAPEGHVRWAMAAK